MKTPLSCLLASLALAAALRADDLHRFESNAPSAASAIFVSPTPAPTLLAASSRAGTLDLGLNLTALGRALAHLTPENFTGGPASDSKDTISTPTHRLVTLVRDGITVRDTAGCRTNLLLGREISAPHMTPTNVWTLKLVTTW